LPLNLESLESNVNESKEEAPKEAPKEECKTAKQRKAKSTKGKNSPKAEQAASEEKDCLGALLPDHSMPLDSLLQAFPAVNSMDPLAFPMLNTALPAPLETDPAFMQFVQAMETQQAMFNHAVMLNMHAQRIIQDNLLFAAELDHQLSNSMSQFWEVKKREETPSSPVAPRGPKARRLVREGGYTTSSAFVITDVSVHDRDIFVKQLTSR